MLLLLSMALARKEPAVLVSRHRSSRSTHAHSAPCSAATVVANSLPSNPGTGVSRVIATLDALDLMPVESDSDGEIEILGPFPRDVKQDLPKKLGGKKLGRMVMEGSVGAQAEPYVRIVFFSFQYHNLGPDVLGCTLTL